MKLKMNLETCLQMLKETIHELKKLFSTKIGLFLCIHFNIGQEQFLSYNGSNNHNFNKPLGGHSYWPIYTITNKR